MNEKLVSHDSAGETIYHALTLFMGRGRKHSVEDVAEGTGISSRTLYSYIAAGPEDRRSPSSENLLILCHFFGKGFTSKVLAPTGLGAHDLTPQPGEPAFVISRLMQGSSMFAILGEDHVYCHIDQGKLEPVADEMIEVLTPFSSKRQG